MNLYIGENIKRLRRQKGITQETLADYMHVSTAAVSKWERGETLPDITLVIPLASYFGVSTDEILGLDAAKNSEKIDWYLSEESRLQMLGKEMERFNLITQAYSEFPNDWRIINSYITCLVYDPHYKVENEGDPWGANIHKEELYRLCQRVMDECPVDETRYTALRTLVALYSEDGNIEKAIETAMRFPPYWSSQEELLEDCLEGDEWLAQMRKNLWQLTSELYYKLRRLILHDQTDISHKEKIRHFEKLLALLDLIFEDGDYGFFHQEVSNIYLWLGNRYLWLNDTEQALCYYEKAFYHARKYDTQPKVVQHTSYFVKDYSFDFDNTNSNTELNMVSIQMEAFLSWEDIYSRVKDLPKMQEILAKYRPFMGNKPKRD